MQSRLRTSFIATIAILVLVIAWLMAGSVDAFSAERDDFHVRTVTNFERGSGDGATFLNCAWNDIGKDFFVGRWGYDGPVVVWKFEWRGSACFDNHQRAARRWRIRQIEWRKPTGWTLNLTGWNYDAGDLLRLQSSGGCCPAKHVVREYRGHFKCCIGSSVLNKWPCLRIEMWASGTIGTRSTC